MELYDNFNSTGFNGFSSVRDKPVLVFNISSRFLICQLSRIIGSYWDVHFHLFCLFLLLPLLGLLLLLGGHHVLLLLSLHLEPRWLVHNRHGERHGATLFDYIEQKSSCQSAWLICFFCTSKHPNSDGKLVPTVWYCRGNKLDHQKI